MAQISRIHRQNNPADSWIDDPAHRDWILDQMDVKSLKGIAVVSIEEGEKVGTVDDVLFDMEQRRIIGFKLNKPGFLRSGGIAVMMGDVRSIGKDAVMIPDRERIRELKQERDLQSRPGYSAMSTLRVVTQDGTYVGNLSTLQVEPATGKLTQIEITGGSLMDRLRRNQVVDIDEVVSLGTDVVVIPDKYAPLMDESETTEPEDGEESASSEVSDETEQIDQSDDSGDSKPKRGEILQ
jgi:uncharacterized protein YrrD